MATGVTSKINSSTRHVLDAMKLIAQSAEPLGLAEIASAMGLPASTAHRALMTLEESGFVHRVGHGASFVSGDAIHHLIRSMASLFPARRLLAEEMRALSAALDVTVSLNWRVGWQSIRLLSVEGARESYQIRRVGEARPLHSGIGPLAILSGFGFEEIKRYVEHFFCNPVPGSPPPAAELLNKRAREFDRSGYIRLDPTPHSALVWIAIPLRGPDGLCQASISVGFGPNLLDAPDEAERIARACGGVTQMQSLLDSAGPSAASPFDALSAEDAHIHGLRLQLDKAPSGPRQTG